RTAAARRGDRMDPDRRRFLKAGQGAGGAIVPVSSLRHPRPAAPPRPLRQPAAPSPRPVDMTNPGPDKIPQKPLGRTGERVSILGLGGYHLGTVASVTEAVRLLPQQRGAGAALSAT